MIVEELSNREKMARFFSLSENEQEELKTKMYSLVNTPEYEEAIESRIECLNKQPYHYTEIDEYFCRLADEFREFMNRYNEKDWKMQDVFTLLPNLRPEVGYTLDTANVSILSGSIYKLYFHRSECTKSYPYQVKRNSLEMLVRDFPDYSDDMVINGLFPCSVELPNIFHYIEMDGSIESYIQAFLLHNACIFLPKGWHGMYNDRDFVFTKHDSLFHGRYDSWIYSYKNRMPCVFRLGNAVVVRFTSWNDWTGLVTYDVSIKLNEGIPCFEVTQKTVVIPYKTCIKF